MAAEEWTICLSEWVVTRNGRWVRGPWDRSWTRAGSLGGVGRWESGCPILPPGHEWYRGGRQDLLLLLILHRRRLRLELGLMGYGGGLLILQRRQRRRLRLRLGLLQRGGPTVFLCKKRTITIVF